MNKFSKNFKNISQEELKLLCSDALRNIKNPGKGIGAELFDAILSITPQPTVEAVIVDNINKPTKVLVTRRDDHNYPKSCHFPGSFIRYGETFQQRLFRLIMNELGVKVKKFKDTNIKYNSLEKKNKRHIIGFYFLVELKSSPEKEYKWINCIPKNLVNEHKNFLKNYFGWLEGDPIFK